jgi:hemoglobin
MTLSNTHLAIGLLAVLALHAPATMAQSAAVAPAMPMTSTQPDTGDRPAMAIPTAPREAGVPDPAPRHPELAGVFKDFGGMPGLTALMDDLMTTMMADTRLHPFFANADRDRIKRQLAEQFCVILDGGCTFSGRDMKAAHASLGIDHANFNALVEDLQLAMQRRHIPFRSQNKLLAVLAPMHREIINR